MFYSLFTVMWYSLSICGRRVDTRRLGLCIHLFPLGVIFLLFSFLKTQSKYLLFLRNRFPWYCCTYYILSGKETHPPLPDYYSECRVCFLEVAMFVCVPFWQWQCFVPYHPFCAPPPRPETQHIFQLLPSSQPSHDDLFMASYLDSWCIHYFYLYMR